MVRRRLFEVVNALLRRIECDKIGFYVITTIARVEADGAE